MDDDSNRNLPPCGTQIDDLPSCLIVDILLRLPNKSLLKCRVVCRSWYLVFSDPLFVKLHLERSPTYLIRQKTRKDSDFTCLHSSSNGLLCLENCKFGDEIYVCNPVLGEYITIPIGKTDCVNSVLGFCYRSNQFKVLRINSAEQIPAEIYTIGDGTRRWKSVGIAPSCPNFKQDSLNFFLNGSIHWVDVKSHQIIYFNFDSEQFGSIPSPPGFQWQDFNHMRVDVFDGCLSFHAYAHPWPEVWIMKEYGVEESWTKIFSIPISRDNLPLYREINRKMLGLATVYNPSFISLNDVAKGEQLTVMSRTRTMMSCSQRLSDYLRSRALDLFG